MSTPTFTKSGSKAASTVKLDAAVFGVEVTNHELLKAAYIAYLANGRLNLAVTKTRGLVSGGGKKPWKQKGTGRARFGSSRNPIWRGGGIAFGPTGQENYTHKLSVASKRTALRQALSLAHTEGKLMSIEAIELQESKTKHLIALLDKIKATGNVLIAVETKDPAVVRAAQNIPNVKVVSAQYLNVYDVLNADTLVMTTKATDAIVAWLGGAK